ELPLPVGTQLPVRHVILGIRPTDLEDGVSAEPSLPRLRVRASVVEDLGAESHVIFAVDAPRVVAEAVRAAKDTGDSEEGLLLADDSGAFSPARLAGRRIPPPGPEVELAAAPPRLHFFDPATGEVLAR